MTMINAAKITFGDKVDSFIPTKIDNDLISFQLKSQGCKVIACESADKAVGIVEGEEKIDEIQMHQQPQSHTSSNSLENSIVSQNNQI